MSLGIYAATCIRHYISHENTVLFWNRYSNIQNIYWSSFTVLYWYNLPYSRRSYRMNKRKYELHVFIGSLYNEIQESHSKIYWEILFCIQPCSVRIWEKKTRIHGGFMEWLLLLLGGFWSVKDLFLVSLFLLVIRFLFI